MLYKKIFLVLLLFYSSAPFASALCESIDNELQNMECLSKRFYMLEQKLIASQKDLESNVLSYYSADLSLGKQLVEAMRSTQHLWLQYRNQQCQVLLFEIEKSSPSYESSMQACVVDFNRDRINQLESFKDNFN